MFTSRRTTISAFRKFFNATLLCALTILLLPGAAAADTFCVGTPTSCTDPLKQFPMTAAGFQDALSLASTQAGDDRVEIAAGTIDIASGSVTTSPGAGNAVNIDGVGNGNSNIHVTVPNGIGMSFNFSSAPGSEISNLNIKIDGPVSATRHALYMNNGRVNGVNFEASSTGGYGTYALTALGSAECLYCSFKLDGAGAAGVNASPPVSIRNSSFENVGSTAVSTTGVNQSGSGTTTIQNSTFKALRTGVVFDSGQINVRDSAFDLGAAANAQGFMVANYNNSTSTLVGSIDGVTIAGSGTNQTGMAVYGETTNPAGESATGTVKNSLILLTGAGSTDLRCQQSGFGVASLTTSFTAKRAASPVISGTCAGSSSSNVDSDAMTFG